MFKIEIPIPPLAEQKRIAGLLDATDALRVKRRETLTQLDTLLQSVFLDMFGDPDTNPMEWAKRRIESVFHVARGGSPRPIRDYLTESEDGLRWIMIGDAIEGSRYITSTSKRIKPEGLRKSRMVHKGDLLLTNSMSFGKPYILKTEGCIHDGWLVLSPKDKRMSTDFFYNLLSTATLYREFKRKAAGAVVKNLNTTLVKQVAVPVPPLDLQRQFAAVVESVEQQKTRQQTHLAGLNTLLASLQSRAFSGNL
ncbi:MAG: restriction endonuclease subunit S [Gemmatimonadota bacterium]|nr:restriction endonuclease subunit S [Gemmatimonadota bacterium]